MKLLTKLATTGTALLAVITVAEKIEEKIKQRKTKTNESNQTRN